MLCCYLFGQHHTYNTHITSMPSSATPHARSSKNTRAPPNTRTASASASKSSRIDATHASSSNTSSSRARLNPSSRAKARSEGLEDATHQLDNLQIGDDVLTRKTRPNGDSIHSSTTTGQKPAQTAEIADSRAVDELASEISARLAIDEPSSRSSSKAKLKQTINNEKSAATNALQSLRIISQTLSDAVQLGWKVSKPTKDFTIKALRTTVAGADAHINILRGSVVGRQVDIERTVVHMCGRLVPLELVRAHLSLSQAVFLAHNHSRLMKLSICLLEFALAWSHSIVTLKGSIHLLKKRPLMAGGICRSRKSALSLKRRRQLRWALFFLSPPKYCFGTVIRSLWRCALLNLFI